MRIIDNSPQGSEAWLQHRRTTRNASEAPIIMGASPYVTRAELIRQRATGVEREIDAATQFVFDRGHEVEPKLRALAEAYTGEDFYPITATSDDGYLSASFDGVTLDETALLEAKQSNAEKMRLARGGILPSADWWQVVQQFAVCETATRCLYVIGDGTEKGSVILTIHRHEIEADIPRLLAGWAQFDADVADYVPAPAAEPSALQVRSRTEALPVVSARVDGKLSVIDNFPTVEERVYAFLEHDLIRSPQTDEDFIALDDQIKAMKNAEAQLAATWDNILAQVESLDSAKRRKEKLAALLRENRLLAERLLSTEKDRRRGEIVTNAAAAVRAYFDTINATLGAHAFQPAQSLTLDLGAAIKGKRTLSSMRDAIDSAVAREKIEASQRAEGIRARIALLDEVPADMQHLFPDRVALCASKNTTDLDNLIALRVLEHARKVQEERERIRKEESDRLEREQRERDAHAERERLAAQKADPTPEPAQPAPAPVVVQQAANTQYGMRAPAASARIKLGDINARIAPMTITADGLAQLGINSVGTERSAKLYDAADFLTICTRLHGVLTRAESAQAA